VVLRWRLDLVAINGSKFKVPTRFELIRSAFAAAALPPVVPACRFGGAIGVIPKARCAHRRCGK